MVRRTVEEKVMWYIIKKKKSDRWVAYELEERPQLKRGYEMKGPYKNFIECMMAANGVAIKPMEPDLMRDC